MNELGTPSRPAGRRTLLRGLGVLTAGATFGLAIPPSATAAADAGRDACPCAPVTPQEAQRRLVSGNRRFAAGSMLHPRQDADRRHDVALSQDPFAQVFSCIDSRVPPEIVFDQGLGDLFVIRTGAQTLDGLVQGSVEYGPLEYGTPLIVVMGHQRCGAVAAAVQSLEHGISLGPHLDEIVTALEPAYNAAKASGVPEHRLVDATTRWQTALTVEALEADARLTPLIGAGTLAIQGAYYSLDTGEVGWSQPRGTRA